MDSPVFPGDLFKMINILFVAHADAALRPLGLTCAQSDLLEYLAERDTEETTVQDIGQHFHLKHPTVIGLIHRLEQKGFVTSSVSQRDRRCRIIRLTKKFDEVQRVMRETRDTIDARVTRGFTAGELTQLEEYLSRVYHNIREV
ncbi:MAG TPA: MarR family transcriptional regulator [Candidatus Agathobaculum pullicola]|nr:MarR family transcriptional regulator [Candidatus Agathobaculum pullicola]